MTVLQAIVLGAIQGFTEFLPVSSSGHLVIAKSILGVTLPGITFEVIVHLGTLLAVLMFFAADIWQVICAFLSEITSRDRRRKGIWGNPQSRLGLLIIAGTVPAALAGVLLKRPVEAAFGAPLLAGALLLVTGVVLWRSEDGKRGRRRESDLRLGDALSVGVAQAIAILPGLSRSGLTISTCLRRRFDRALAAKYSFMLSIPVIAGAGIMDLVEVLQAKPVLPWPPLLAGTLTAFLTGLLAIKFTLGLVRAGRFRYFAIYTWIVGGGVVVHQLMRLRG